MYNYDENYLNTVLDDGLTIREHMERGYENAKRNEKNSSNPKFHRSFDEIDESYEFSQKYAIKLSKIESKIYFKDSVTIQRTYKNKLSIIKSILKCNYSIFNYYKLKRFCYKNNGKIYFQDKWEYCHNSNCDCFEYVETTKEYKEQLIKYLKNKG